MRLVDQSAPSDSVAVQYDRDHLALYAALLDAADAGQDWTIAASDLMGIDITDPGAEACWRSHLDRARWIIGGGLESAISAFGAK
ncbi:hypothetical protein [Sphingobium sp. YG1]|uniref:hypothetical protein n=1 Tax=Sphingobium sp. YG1 TaxID=2082188 RepID=UPI000DBADD10|nr:hypothetical protein [Sphingobium sp. YG1]BBD01465.1 hypothetical protein YGS_C1P2720 [Sphingobium sp. YG1]